MTQPARICLVTATSAARRPEPEDAMPDVPPVSEIREKLDEIANRVHPGRLRRGA